jgi:MoxR-like ATPase
MAQEPLMDVSTLVAERRSFFGADFVSGRVAPEAEARALLDEAAGHMSSEQAASLGEMLNRHVKAGVIRHDRFSPAFVGAALKRVTEDLVVFNARVSLLWHGTEEDALAALDETLKNRALFPGAGSSLPSALMYLRDPENYAVWITATMNGLKNLTGDSGVSKGGGRESYLEFCALVRQFREQYDIAPQEVDAILAEASRHTPASQPTAEPTPETVEPSVETLAAACSLPVEQVEEWVSLLRGRKRQAVFYGPPGTGKTHVARLLANYLAGDASRVRTVQFHPSYSYEDFIEGLRPQLGASAGGQLSYVIRPGLFLDACRAAREETEQMHVLIIDELNRADLGSVLGELMMLLEYRDEVSVQLPYSQNRFTIPKNLVVIGTMNTADRSLALVDFAMRRRFHAIELRPNRAVLALHLTKLYGEEAAKPALAFFDRVQAAVGLDSSFAPGHSYWMVDDPGAQELQRVWKYEIRPYLEEFWFETPRRVAELDDEIEQLIVEQS